MGPSVKAWGGIRHFRWLRVGPSEGGTTQIHIRARHPWGATIFEVVPFSKAVVGSSGVGHHPNSDSISPSSGGVRFAQQSPLSIAAGGGPAGRALELSLQIARMPRQGHQDPLPRQSTSRCGARWLDAMQRWLCLKSSSSLGPPSLRGAPWRKQAGWECTASC